MRRIFFNMIGFAIVLSLSNSLVAQWAVDKYAREDVRYARFLQGSETVVVDGIEDAIWMKADSVILGYKETSYLPGSGYDMWNGPTVAGDTANAVVKFLYKEPYLYILYRIVDKSVGGWDWGQSDGIIMSLKNKTTDHMWTTANAEDKKIEHFYTYIQSWDTNAVQVGHQPLFRGNDAVGGIWPAKRTANQIERWTAVTTVQGGISNDSLPDLGWTSEHRIRVDSLGYSIGDVFPFMCSIFDGDNWLDTQTGNNTHTRTWWNTPWNENWYYGALYLDPNVTTTTTPGIVPPIDYIIPHLNTGQTITVDGDLSDWQTSNTLHFRAKYEDETVYDGIKGTGDWGSGYYQTPINGNSALVLDPGEIDFYVTFDDANLYIGAKVTDQIVSIPDAAARRDKASFIICPRNYTDGAGIFPVKELSIAVDSVGGAKILEDLIGLADTAGVEYSLALGPNTNINDITTPDDGFFVEIKIPFSALGYPTGLGDSVVFLGGSVNDLDVFDDVNSNYLTQSWWFTKQKGQHAPAWCVLAPAGAVGVDEEPTIPISIELLGNYPNPFNPTTNIKFSVNVVSDVTFTVFNILGQTVSVTNRLNVQPGFNQFSFDATGLASGVYLYQLKFKNASGSQVVDSKVSKMVLIK